MSKHKEIAKETEWAVQYGGGLLETFTSPFIAASHIKELRRKFEAGEDELDPEDYEPMLIFRRQVVTTASDWKLWAA